MLDPMTTKMALCVGINYQGTPNQLGGCLNDAADWAGVLTARGYQVLTVTERQATRQGILDALETMRSKVGSRGRAVFTYSGHGTFLPDLDGDEVDGFDEALVPIDYARSGVITDDDLFTVLSRRRTGSRWVSISDSCHSGTLSRALPTPLGLRVGAPRFLPPLEHLAGRARDSALTALGGADTPAVPRGLSRTSGVWMGGCQDDQVSYDAVIGGRGRGAFSAAALGSLATGPSSFTQWHDRIRQVLPSSQYPQTPQLQASYTQRKWAPLD